MSRATKKQNSPPLRPPFSSCSESYLPGNQCCADVRVKNGTQTNICSRDKKIIPFQPVHSSHKGHTGHAPVSSFRVRARKMSVDSTRTPGGKDGVGGHFAVSLDLSPERSDLNSVKGKCIFNKARLGDIARWLEFLPNLHTS